MTSLPVSHFLRLTNGTHTEPVRQTAVGRTAAKNKTDGRTKSETENGFAQN